MARATFVKKALKENPVAKKGESYYWWKFRFGGKHYSKTPPRRSQLTQSDFLGQVYDIEDELSEIPDNADLEDVQSQRDDIVSRIQDLASECQDKLSNMPDSLQQAPTGEMLQNRSDECESWVSELEGVDLDLEKGDDESECDFLERVSDAIDELRNCSYNGE